MRTNADAKNFRSSRSPAGKQTDRSGVEGAHRRIAPTRSSRTFALYDTFIAASVRTGGLRKVQVLPNDRASAFFIDAQDAAYAMTVVDTPDRDDEAVRYTYDVDDARRARRYELDVATGERTLLKQQPVPTYDPSQYASEYLHATASDGTQIPISVVYRKDTPRDGTAPLLVYGYGSYGISMEPRFSATRVEPARSRLRLRDRAHPRRPGDGPRLVRGRQAAAEDEHVHRLHRRDRVPRRAEATARAIGCSRWAAAPAAC